MPGAAGRGLLQFVHGLARFDCLAVDGQQHVAGSHAGAGSGRRRIDIGGDDPGGALHPQHAVFDVVAGGALDDVGQAEQQQRRGDPDR